MKVDENFSLLQDESKRKDFQEILSGNDFKSIVETVCGRHKTEDDDGVSNSTPSRPSAETSKRSRIRQKVCHLRSHRLQNYIQTQTSYNGSVAT